MNARIDIEWLPIPLVLADAQWRVIAVNRAACERLSLAVEKALGAAIGEWLEGGRALIESLDVQAREGRRASRAAVRLNLPGRRVDVDVLVERIPESPGDSKRRGSPAYLIVLLDAAIRVAQQEELTRLQRALNESERARNKMGELTAELAEGADPVRIIGSSAPVLTMLDQVDRVSASPATVLIAGESGSGKELVARAIHTQSPRARRPLVAVNCAALPETLLESELFGHERGAFTGAERQRLGKFELADGGTLFMDEVAELSPAAQAKLLRVLQEGTFERVGGTETIQVDVRLIAATHRDLPAQVERGRFREDLFYRLNVFRIDVPPLRDRREDIRALAEFFHDRHARRLARPVLPISERSMRRLLTYRWPGNVRELENAIERATLLADPAASELEVELPTSPVRAGGAPGGVGGARDTSNVPRDVLLDLTLDQLQRLQIMHALETRGYRVFGDSGAAEKLSINPQTLLSRMDKLGIPRPRAMRAAFSKRGRALPGPDGGPSSSPTTSDDEP